MGLACARKGSSECVEGTDAMAISLRGLEFVAKLLQAEFNIVAVTVAGVCLPICVCSFWGTYAVVPVLETAPGTVVAGGHAMLAGRERHECVRLKTHENRRS